MLISRGYRVAVEQLWRDWVRQRLHRFLGDRVAAYVPLDAAAWPRPGDRATRFLPAAALPARQL
jgi:hypothetical protein